MCNFSQGQGVRQVHSYLTESSKETLIWYKKVILSRISGGVDMSVDVYGYNWKNTVVRACIILFSMRAGLSK